LERRTGSSLNNETFINYWTEQATHFDLYVMECGYEKCDPLHFWGPAVKRFHSIHYILSGEGELHMNGQTFRLGRGDGFYLSPRQVVHYIASESNPWEYRWVSFNGSQAQSTMNLTTVSDQNPVFHFDRDDRFARTMCEIYDCSHSGHVADFLLTGRLYLFMADFVSLFRNESHADFEASREYVSQALRFIEGNLQKGCTVESLTRHLGLSRTYIYKIFMKHVGMSPTDYMANLRISHAKDLLRSSRCSVSEAALSVGYDDPFYFSKVFKKIVGKSPAAYLKDMLAE